ncbi:MULTISPECIES: transcriptional regulator [Actinomadura]|uniref:Thiaminase-2/PQQC domain-containing protein n=1 Tax=Actinomadura yumaensis TaxID=111807 RepID=A0ABW2CNB3_9ACTN|nr:transcriptional regulator [Actinomadura sp. J1-007]MWK40272.1 transcriptional regulator [Actinomadura sp. J1-007]
MAEHIARDLAGAARREIAAASAGNRFLDLLEAGQVPRERLAWLAGEEYRIVTSDRRSFALLAARYPEPPAGEMFLSLAQGELRALELLRDFAGALGESEKDLIRYEPMPEAQAYPAYLAQRAAFGTSSEVALAMLANLEEWGSYCGRTAEALRTRYGLSEEAVGFFRFFAESPPGFEDQALAVVVGGLAAGEDPQDAARAARMLHAYESAFWNALANGL